MVYVKKNILKDEKYVVTNILLMGGGFKECKTCLKHTRIDIKDILINSTKKCFRNIIERSFKTYILEVNKLQVNREMANRLRRVK